MFAMMGLRRNREGGFSVIELSMTVALLGIVIASFYTAYNGFLRDVSFAERLGEIEHEARPVLNGLVIELRQAIAPNPAANGQAVEFLSANKIVFYADRRDAGGPERFTYERSNCVDGLCDLEMRIQFADSNSQYPTFTHSTAGDPDFEVTVLRRVPESVKLFQGVRLAGTTEVLVDSCDRLDVGGGGSTDCAFDRVVIRIEVAPKGAGVRPSNYVVTESVVLRNVRL